MKKRYFRPIYLFIACCPRCDRHCCKTERRRTVAYWSHSSLEFVCNL